MYPNPLNPRLRALHQRGEHSGESPQPSSSQPETSRNPVRTTDERFLRHRRRTQEWVNLVGDQNARAAVTIHALGPRIYRSPDNERFEKIVIPESKECAWKDPNIDQQFGPLEFEVFGSLSERLEGLKMMYDASIMAGANYALSKTMLFRMDAEKALRKCEQVLAPLASPTWIDLHTEGDVVDKPVDEKENSGDEKIDSETKGKTDDMSRDTAKNEKDEADEADGGKKEQKKKYKKRKRRVK
ncbi:hypothetical protein F4679DRAFT_587624 [Xylaria curta]|nr:hypothetical protein F4679DRAFT_587624 [Xylaria curta]